MSKNAVSSIQCVLFPPLVEGLWLGNDTSFILTAILGSVYLLLNNKDLWAGLCLSLVLLKPQLAVPLAAALLFVRPRPFWAFVAGGLMLSLYSLALVGFEGFW